MKLTVIFSTVTMLVATVAALKLRTLLRLRSGNPFSSEHAAILFNFVKATIVRPDTLYHEEFPGCLLSSNSPHVNRHNLRLRYDVLRFGAFDWR